MPQRPSRHQYSKTKEFVWNPFMKYRETVLQRRNTAGLWAEQETGPMAEEIPLKNPFDSSWLQQKWMDLTSQQGTAFWPIISLLNLSFFKIIKYVYTFTSNILGTRIFPTLMNKSNFLSFGLISHLRWHQSSDSWMAEDSSYQRKRSQILGTTSCRQTKCK